MDFIRAFGTVVRNKRKDCKLSQEQLAEAAGLHVNHISFIERAKTSASLQAIESIAKALNVKPSDLILSAEALLDEAP